MGDFRIEVNATGAHGCQREIKNGEFVDGCGLPNCPDCVARKFVAELKERGIMVKDALLVHWPNSDPTIVDNLLTRRRGGSF